MLFPPLAKTIAALAFLILPALAHSADQSPAGAAQEGKLSSRPFIAEQWGQLKVGMSLQDVFNLLGAPAMQLMRNAGEGKVETTWNYVYDGGATEKEVRFGVPIPPDTKVIENAFAGTPNDYATADLPKLGLLLGTLFDWSGREAAVAETATEPPKSQ